ncbi:hypothetical protein E2562_008792 [Oryza meyeriana var. granulata]|uniref:Uncharacterized protein n=1 Tax=Oryza meyeriana var. granulata TaxID=110450 RepID=A0A6G1D0M1_9ORYZ|nr:hypothetical protein E2562_008792 [Oryza meyeriana var. granulata]
MKRAGAMPLLLVAAMYLRMAMVAGLPWHCSPLPPTRDSDLLRQKSAVNVLGHRPIAATYLFFQLTSLRTSSLPIPSPSPRSHSLSYLGLQSTASRSATRRRSPVQVHSTLARSSPPASLARISALRSLGSETKLGSGSTATPFLAHRSTRTRRHSPSVSALQSAASRASRTSRVVQPAGEEPRGGERVQADPVRVQPLVPKLYAHVEDEVAPVRAHPQRDGGGVRPVQQLRCGVSEGERGGRPTHLRRKPDGVFFVGSGGQETCLEKGGVGEENETAKAALGGPPAGVDDRVERRDLGHGDETVVDAILQTLGVVARFGVNSVLTLE